MIVSVKLRGFRIMAPWTATDHSSPIEYFIVIIVKPGEPNIRMMQKTIRTIVNTAVQRPLTQYHRSDMMRMATSVGTTTLVSRDTTRNLNRIIIVSRKSQKSQSNNTLRTNVTIMFNLHNSDKKPYKLLQYPFFFRNLGGRG